MKSFTLRQLEYLVAVAEHGTLAAAAADTHVSAATMSQALTSLERSLGIQVLRRRAAKGSVLTPAGERATSIARRLLQEADDLSRLGAQVSGEVVGPLRIACYPTLSPWLLPPLAEVFRSRYPGATLAFEDFPLKDPVAPVVDGKLDAVVTFRRHLSPGDVERRVVLRAGVKAMFPTGHALADVPEVSLDQLAPLPAVVLDSSPHLDLVSDIMARSGLTPDIAIRSRQFDTVRSLVARDFGYSLTMGLPHSRVSTEGLRLAFVPVRTGGLDNPVEIVLPRLQRRSAAVVALVEECTRILSELQDRISAAGPHTRGD